MPRLVLVALLPLLTSACIIRLNSRDYMVDGVELEQQHTETIEVQAWEASGLTLRSAAGDIHVEPTSGTNRIEVTLHEKTLGDAYAVFAGGRLEARTHSGEPHAIGDVRVYSNDLLPVLDVETGMGDIVIHGAVQQGEARLDTGMGSIGIRGASFTKLTAETGMGDIDLADVTAAEARLESGLGDVSVTGSRLQSVRADTGMGDIDCRDSELGHHEFDAGLGSVRTR